MFNYEKIKAENEKKWEEVKEKISKFEPKLIRKYGVEELIEEVRLDHYDGVNAIYRLAAFIEPEGTPQLNLNDINELSIRPRRVNLSGDFIELVWFSDIPIVLKNIHEYRLIINDFIDFLNKESEGKSFQFVFNSGIFSDDPQEPLSKKYSKFDLDFAHDEVVEIYK